MIRQLPLLDGVPRSDSKIRTRNPVEYGHLVKVPFPNSLVCLAIEAYQKITEDCEHRCNFIPSCSEYAKLAFASNGFFTALAMTIERLKECDDHRSKWPRFNKP